LEILMLKPSHSLSLTLCIAAAVVLGGCASGTGSQDFSREQTRTVQEVQMGVVESVREVNIEGTRTPIGAGAGAIAGGVAGSTVGGGSGRIVGATVGAVLGGLGGAAAEEAITRQRGVEVTVKLDSGRLIAITQSADEVFNVGDRVRVLSGGGTTRVSH
jgi:outer membrane lipoprotein SlyB